MQVAFVIQPDTNYQAFVAKYFLNQFMQTPDMSGPPLIGEKILLNTVSDTVNLVNQVVNNYFNMDKTGNLEIYYPAPGPYDRVGVEMFVTPLDITG